MFISPSSRSRQRRRKRKNVYAWPLAWRATKTRQASFGSDNDKSALEDQVTDILVTMLVNAETSYRNSLVWQREWIIERKAEAEAELKRRKEEAERKAREREEKAARERIA